MEKVETANPEQVLRLESGARLGRDVKAPVEAVVTEVMARVFTDIPGPELDRTKRLLRQVLGNLQEVTGK